MWFGVVLYWHVVDNIYLWYCIELLFISHQGTDALAEVADMVVDIIQEGFARTFSHDHDFLCICIG